MKTEKALLGMAMALMLMVHASDVSAQRQRDGRGDNRNGNRGREQRGNDHRDDRDRHDHHYTSRRDNHHYDNHHHHGRPVVVHRYQAPRYVYYRDYNTYYDCHRGTYIVLSGRRWVVVSQRPNVIRHIDLNYAYHTDVDYYDDDLPTYLGR